MSGFKTAIKNLLKRILAALNVFPRWILKREFRAQRFERFNERPVELAFVFKAISTIYPKRVLDVGSGTTALPHLIRSCGCTVTAVDNVRDYWPTGAHNRHFYVKDDDITATKLSEKFDLVTCISVLEHIESAEIAVKNMISLLNDGGYLILTFPYSENCYKENVYQLEGSSYGQNAPYRTQSFSRVELNAWVKNNDCKIIEQQYWRFWDGDFWTVGSQVIPPSSASSGESHQLTCILLRKS